MESIDENDENDESVTEYIMRTERPPVMRAEYSVNLLNGNHGIWLFVSKNGAVVAEQAGLQTTDDALELAKNVIKAEEYREAQRKEAEAAQISLDMDGG